MHNCRKDNLCPSCKHLEYAFEDPYYKRNTLWYLHTKTTTFTVPIHNFDVYRSIMGCDLLYRLSKSIPRYLIVPFIALAYNTPNKILSSNFTIFFRKYDGAVAIGSTLGTFYFVPEEYQQPFDGDYEIVHSWKSYS